MQDMREMRTGSCECDAAAPCPPAGGDFELILSDGLNTARIVQAR